MFRFHIGAPSSKNPFRLLFEFYLLTLVLTKRNHQHKNTLPITKTKELTNEEAFNFYNDTLFFNQLFK
ncbi:MAG: hypothetical protein ACJAVE_001671 [Polaribacter sp.]|jgi:hypothetical protein